MDRLKALAVFKAVVDQGSFARAAEAMEMSPAVVTRTVQELEALLAVRLLQRTTRRIALTPVGQEVLARAHSLLACYDELSTMSSLLSSEPAGKVRLSAPAWLGRSFLGALAAAYLADCPKVSLELRMHTGEADAADSDADIRLCLESELRASLVARRMGSIELALFASPAYLQRKGEPLYPQALADHDCLAGGPSRPAATWRFQSPAGGRPQGIEVRSVLNANQPETLLGAAIHGAGIALLPELLAGEALADGRLRRVMAAWRAEPPSLYLAYECRKHQPASVRRLIELLAARFEASSDSGDTGSAAPPRTALMALSSPQQAPQAPGRPTLAGRRAHSANSTLHALPPQVPASLLAA